MTDQRYHRIQSVTLPLAAILIVGGTTALILPSAFPILMFFVAYYYVLRAAEVLIAIMWEKGADIEYDNTRERKFFLDDERYPPSGTNGWVIVRTHDEFFEAVEKYGMPKFVSFDHDLGDETRGSGLSVAKEMIEMDLDHTVIPDDFDFYVHSQNPVGAENIDKLLVRYLDFRE